MSDPQRPDVNKLATMVRHWIEHNSGHQESYLEWRAKLLDADLPATVAALERVAALAGDANDALAKALAELEAAGAAGGQTSHGQRPRGP